MKHNKKKTLGVFGRFDDYEFLISSDIESKLETLKEKIFEKTKKKINFFAIYANIILEGKNIHWSLRIVRDDKEDMYNDIERRYTHCVRIEQNEIILHIDTDNHFLNSKNMPLEKYLKTPPLLRLNPFTSK